MTDTLKVLAIVSLITLGSATAAFSQNNLDLSLYGERGTNGYIDASFYNVKDDGSGQPSGVYLTVNPYFYVGPGVPSYPTYREYVSAADFTVQNAFTTDGQLISYDFDDKSNGDFFHLSYDQNAMSPYYQQATFNADIGGHNIFLNPQESASEGGFVTYSVSAAPEPGAWALMLLGVGFIGWALGYRRRVLVDHKAKLAAIG